MQSHSCGQGLYHGLAATQEIFLLINILIHFIGEPEGCRESTVLGPGPSNPTQSSL